MGLDTYYPGQRITGNRCLSHCSSFLIPGFKSLSKKNLTFGTTVMGKILVAGGCGYIGSHTIVDLIENGFDVISIDNNSRSNPRILEGVERITGKKIKNYKVDLCNFDDTFAVFQENSDIEGIIHFAAYKAVGESVEKPLMYFEN